MWIALALASALGLGCYDVAKKLSLRRNSVMWVLLSVSVISTAIMSPWFGSGDLHDIPVLIPKALLVTTSWISGLVGMKLLPLTTVSTIKASRPVFVILLSMLIFGERLNLWQWAGVTAALAALWMLGRTSRREGIEFSNNKGILWMALSVVSGVCSALYDKFAIGRMEPLFVQSWSNLFITIFMAIVLIVKGMKDGEKRDRFQWDWMLAVTALLISAADACYFIALSCDGALLSVISLIRRFSVVVTFVLGALFFKEKQVGGKAVSLLTLMAGIAILALAS